MEFHLNLKVFLCKDFIDVFCHSWFTKTNGYIIWSAVPTKFNHYMVKLITLNHCGNLYIKKYAVFSEAHSRTVSAHCCEKIQFL